jgi:hypothetical protein
MLRCISLYVNFFCRGSNIFHDTQVWLGIPLLLRGHVQSPSYSCICIHILWGRPRRRKSYPLHPAIGSAFDPSIWGPEPSLPEQYTVLCDVGVCVCSWAFVCV